MAKADQIDWHTEANPLPEDKVEGDSSEANEEQDDDE